MNNKSLGLVFFCLLSMVQGAPNSPRNNPSCLMAVGDCELDSGPVCGIDATGLPRTFENSCVPLFESCRSGTFFVEVKPGEC